jgi:hypothetical protein
VGNYLRYSFGADLGEQCCLVNAEIDSRSLVLVKVQNSYKAQQGLAPEH